MSDTNLISAVVKILEIPNQKVIDNNIFLTQCRVQFPQVRNDSLVHLIFWGNLARDMPTYYTINDYVLIEGYLSLKDGQNVNLEIQIPKKVEIVVLKIYPFILSS